MPDNQLIPPWQLCDTACRQAMFVCAELDKTRRFLGMSHETLAARSGLSVMAVTRIMHSGGCNLAEILCLCAVLDQPAPVLFKRAVSQPAPAATDIR